MIKKRFGFTLIEIIIATSLFAIIIFSTTTLFFRYQKLKTRISDLKPYVLERAFFYNKMIDLTLSCDTKTITNASKTYNDYLAFDFDNGVKENPQFSGKCKCELFRTYTGDLNYTITAENGETLTRTLLTNIKGFHHEIQENYMIVHFIDSQMRTFAYSFDIKHSQKEKK